MNAPNASTTPPATRWPTGDRIQVLMALAVKPNTTVNTTVNPRMNIRTGTTGRRRGPSTGCPPVTNARYPGTSGSTHGDANDTNPAAKASAGPHHAVCTTWPASAIIPAPSWQERSAFDGRARAGSNLREARAVRDSGSDA